MTPRSEKPADQSELFIALVAAVGTNVEMVGDQVATQLDDYGYSSQLIRLSDYLAETTSASFRGKPFDEELWLAMDAGDELRHKWDRNDALALHAISDIVVTREEEARHGTAKAVAGLPPYLDRHAFILRSLKTPNELETLRAVYGPRLVVIGAYSPKGALLDAARRGVPVTGATMYTTTFPCHNCARHIVGAGIRRVVFVEPYPKSRAGDLHEDSIKIAESPVDDERVAFEPFVGVAPRRYLEAFDAAARERLGHVGRKDKATGRKQSLVKQEAKPLVADAGLPGFIPELREYRIKERLALDRFLELTSGPSDPSGPS